MSEETLVVSKPAWASKGILGSVVVILVSAMSLASVFIPSLRDIQINTDGLVETISGILTLAFGALALWGRIKANSPVHFINRKTVPGGEFNPEAEVRRAQPVQRPGAGGRGGLNKGYVRLPALLAGVCWIGIALFCVAVMELGRARASSPDVTITDSFNRYADITDFPNITGRQAQYGGMLYCDWIRSTPPVDERPFLVRLITSASPSTSWKFATNSTTGAWEAHIDKVQINFGTDL